MVEPLTAAALGGLALDKAQSAITKWVTANLSARAEVALRDRVLRQGRPAKDQQTELVAVIKAAVDLTAAEQFPAEERLQGLFRKALLNGPTRDWPLVNGSDLTYIADDVYEWVIKNDSQPDAVRSGGEDRASHPYVVLLCRNILTQYGFRAENSGAKNSILYPRWHRFWTTELFAGQQTSPGPARATSVFFNDFVGPVDTVIQGQQITVNTVAPATSWPRRFGTIPPLATAHQKRSIDEKLATMLTEDNTVVCQVLSGMGGVGKTQIAANYAHQRWSRREVDLLIWVSATTRDAIIAAYAEARTELIGSNRSDSESAAKSLLAWLDRPNAPRWLIVLDNLTDPTHLNGLWPPANHRGRTIATTRRRDAALDSQIRRRIDVELYTPAEGLRYLSDRLGHNSRVLDGAAELTEDLGHMPLAIAQAAAFLLDEPGLTCNDYRDMLADQAIPLDRLSPEMLAEEYPHSFASALAISIDRANQDTPQGFASVLLDLASLLDPAGIPVRLFSTEAMRNFLNFVLKTYLGSDNDSPEPTKREITAAIGRLHRLNLVNSDGDLIQVHSLVQRSCYKQLDQDIVNMLVLANTLALTEIWPENTTASAFHAVMRANVTRLRGHAEPVSIGPEFAHLLFLHGASLGNCGLVSYAVEHFQDLQHIVLSLFGPEHHLVDSVLTHLAKWRGEGGDPVAAAEVFETLHRRFVHQFGPDDPHVLRARSSLAIFRGEAGDATGAAEAFEELLVDHLRILGADDPSTLTVRNNLAYWQGEAGDSARAVDAFEALLVDYLRILGADDPSTLTVRNNLANSYRASGNHDKAAETFEALLADCHRVLGPDHPRTLSTSNNLAATYLAAGLVPKAIEAYDTLLSTQLRLMGPNHPGTLKVRSNLLTCHVEAGDPARAADGYESLLADFLRVFGPDHPNTFTIRSNLASCQGKVGMPSQAAEAFAALLTDQTRILGPAHIDVLNTRDNLAFWRRQASHGDT
ncbi:hypothetical protein GCM10009853_046320 [Glycomyces scopariae]